MKNKWLIVVWLFSVNALANPFEYEEHSYAELLLSNDSEQIRAAAKSIHAENTKNTLLLDLAAQILWERSGKRFAVLKGIRYSTKSEADTLSWLAKAVGVSQNIRYKDILMQSGKKTNNEKVKKYIENAISELNIETEEPYLANSIMLDEIKKSLRLAKEADRAKRDDLKILSVQSGQGIRKIYEQYGIPDYVSLGYRRIYRPSVFVYHPLLQIHYFNIGIIQFDSAKSNNQWETFKAFKEFSSSIDMEGEEQLGLLHALMIDNGAIVRKVAQDIFALKTVSDTVLDVAIQRINMSYKSKDKELLDGMAWLLKTIGTSGRKKYIPILDDVIVKLKKSGSGKLKKYARKAKKQLEKTR